MAVVAILVDEMFEEEELAVPRDIRVIDALPVLGTGKIDYVALGERVFDVEVSSDAETADAEGA